MNDPVGAPVPATSPGTGSVSAREQSGELDRSEVVARAVERLPSVARLTAGLGTQVATFLPGRRVLGVRLGEDETEIHIVARYGASLPDVADEVRTTVEKHVPGKPVAVHVDDLDVPGADEPTAPVAALPPASP